MGKLTDLFAATMRGVDARSKVSDYSTAQSEQDKAAGGASLRRLRLEDGKIVVASVSVRSFTRYRKSHQQYGYLQFKVDSKTVLKYIGRVTAPTRGKALKNGWHLLRSRKVAESHGWTWVEKRT